MIAIGGMPIICHIMKKTYSLYGYNEFIICCGDKAFEMKNFFANYYLRKCDVTFDFSNENKMTIHSDLTENWKVTLVDTGLYTIVNVK